MKLIKLVVSALSFLTISTSIITPTLVSASSNVKVVYANNSKGTQVYSSPTSDTYTTGKILKNGSAWKVSSTKVVNNVTWYAVGKNQWISSANASPERPTVVTNKTLYVNHNNWGALAIYNSPYTNHTKTGKTIPDRTAWKVYRTAYLNNNAWYELGNNQWVEGKFMQAKPVENLGKAKYMTATAYDPRVLGNTTFGYDTVAANLSVYPRGTKLKITFNNGTSKNYVVRDTGGFAYSNPNQLDIAMPNGQALQFGRQSIKVQVIH